MTFKIEGKKRKIIVMMRVIFLTPFFSSPVPVATTMIFKKKKQNRKEITFPGGAGAKKLWSFPVPQTVHCSKKSLI